ncbi:26691_t:CDS:2, partial [Racocetra persica]
AQETNLGSSFEVLEGASNNLNEHDNESQNYADLQSDEYTDLDEEIEEQVFDRKNKNLLKYESVNTPAKITDAVKKDQAKNVVS